MFRKKNNIDTDGLNEIIYLSKNILKLLFIVGLGYQLLSKPFFYLLG